MAPDPAPGAVPAHLRAHLPGGLWEDGAEPVRTLGLRPVGDEDQAFLLDTARRLSPARRANLLLARCLAPAVRHVVPRLTVGDREALLLQLRGLTLGDGLECLVSCPRAECGVVMQVHLDVHDVLLPAYAEPRPEHVVSVQHNDVAVVVRLRLPCASDLERLGDVAGTDAEEAAATLLHACVLEVRVDGKPAQLDLLDEEVVAGVERQLAELDPQAEIELELECSECALRFEVLFDAGTFLLQEVDEQAEQLLADVHTLALHYHWGEREILSMSRDRRARYLDLVTATMAAASSPWEPT
ncbi:MAG: hypothetical protein LH477_00495 [Nocardioides sp.]|nr:hypothetical protein [Nocardioides sp.]